MTRAEFRRIRLSLSLTQGDLAKKLGVKLDTVSRWERGVLKLPKIAGLAVRQVRADSGSPGGRG